MVTPNFTTLIVLALLSYVAICNHLARIIRAARYLSSPYRNLFLKVNEDYFAICNDLCYAVRNEVK